MTKANNSKTHLSKKVVRKINSYLHRIKEKYRTITPDEKRILAELEYYRGSANTMFPADFSAQEIEIISLAKQYSMTSSERLVGLLRAIKYISEHDIKGSVVECGVWRGGSSLAACEQLVKLNDTNRDVFLFDTYEGMTAPGKEDVQFDGQHANSFLSIENGETKVGAYWCIADLKDVENTFTHTTYDSSLIHFIKGKVEDTLPHAPIKSIALLRLDTDWYESTYHELVTLYDLVVPGGIVIFDDYGHWQGAKQAVDDFFKERKINPFLHRMDYSGRLMIKPS